MVRPIARKKLRNPGMKTTRRRAEKQRKKKFTGHPLLRELWDPKLTMSENYNKLGLASRLNGSTGGTVHNVIPAHQPDADPSPELTEKELKKRIPQGYGIIERDEEGNVVNVIIADEPQDPLDSDYEPDVTVAKKEGAQLLEKFAMEHEERREKWMSVGERRKLQLFIDKHGQDYKAMFWDHAMNTQQLTKRQLQNKIEKYLAEKEKELGSLE
ncbi:Nucleolar protein 16 [Coemansia erecta]|nr:Nucleolar protein 16 [Coemansia sp. RSA 2618]KAJ2816088.1 Nucleolar protein 16 [Coemansia erecta]